MGHSAVGNPGQLVWEDEYWQLISNGASPEAPVTLELQLREQEGLGHLDDDLASQLGRITNRLIRIIENLPGAGRVEVGRGADGGVGLWFRSSPPADGGTLAEDHMRTVAEKLANWGGDARV